MGWTGVNRPKGMTSREFFEREFNSTEGKIVDIASPSPAETYIAYERGDGKVMGFAVITSYKRGDDYINFTYKEMDEGMGPYIANAPARILDKLSPVEDLYGPVPDELGKSEYSAAASAAEWRAACRANLAKREAAKAVKPGTTVKFADTINFTDGAALDTFKFVKRSTFRAQDGGGLYRLSNWRTRDYEVIA